MHIKKALAAYRDQASGAKKRGIPFKLTFKEWCDFWGDDIDKRGTGHDKLQMQRFGDSGAYEVGNIAKGYPKKNAITRGAVRRNAMASAAKELAEVDRDRAITLTSLEVDDDKQDDPWGVSSLGFQTRTDQVKHGWLNT